MWHPDVARAWPLSLGARRAFLPPFFLLFVAIAGCGSEIIGFLRRFHVAVARGNVRPGTASQDTQMDISGAIARFGVILKERDRSSRSDPIRSLPFRLSVTGTGPRGLGCSQPRSPLFTKKRLTPTSVRADGRKMGVKWPKNRQNCAFSENKLRNWLWRNSFYFKRLRLRDHACMLGDE